MDKMRRALGLVLSIALTFTMFFAVLPQGNTVYADTGAITTFVTRLYEVCLDRAPDQSGLNNWVTNLSSGQVSGYDASSAFVFSNEFQGRNLDNTAFVTCLYRAILGREPDNSGLNSWVNSLNGGSTRRAVFDGIITTNEWVSLCQSYGIAPGVTVTSNNTSTSGVDGFINRLYSGFLGRNADNSGLSSWRSRLTGGRMTGINAAHSFMNSSEFQTRASSMSNSQLVTVFYETFLGRTPTSAEVSSYTSRMGNSLSTNLEMLFLNFANSDEFISYCTNNGIIPGAGNGASMISDAEVTQFFSNSVIIGSSVTEGFNMYFNSRGRGIMGELNVCARVSYSLLNDAASRTSYLPMYNGTPMRARDVIRNSGAQAAFICMGTNDIAGNVVQRYCNYLDDIRSVNPNTIIFVEACTPSRDDHPANSDIRALNEAMEQYCTDHPGFYFIDTFTPFIDGSGRMAARYSSDGNVHMTMAGYARWCEVLSDYVREFIYEQRIAGNF
ncbi:MAG: DUF4214 domain-containing protein [Clostridiales bacterium]|nr:DUF4214 domain-containing protein [Clostridiales bacterium]